MPAPGDHGPAPRDADTQVFGPPAPAEHGSPRLANPASAREVSVGRRVFRVFLIMAGIVAAVLVPVSTGAITLPWTKHSTRSDQASAQASLAAERTAANQQWASAMCTNILDWKTEIQRDATSLNLGFGAPARILDAIATTTRTLNELNKLGLPPAAQTAQARAEADQLRSEIESRVKNLRDAAGSVASGNLAAVGTLLSDLENDKAVGTQIVNELRHVVSVDLGLSLVETRACRQLVGIPI
jgi:hypothetical protein